MRWAVLLAMHAYHTGMLQMECKSCHVAERPGSVTLQRPGHDQCSKCHPAAFRQGRVRTAREETICAQCHAQGASLQTIEAHVEFSHAKHVDGLRRLDPLTGARADCLFCHKAQIKRPTHLECAACHGNIGMQPRLAANSKSEDCRGCHKPEEPPRQIATRYADIRFSHAAHLKQRIDCLTCHAPVAEIPKMLDCVPCHDTAHTLAPQLRLSNCAVCHIEHTSGALPTSHNRNVRPVSHNQSFRMRHSAEASSPDAKCYACHLNVAQAGAVTNRCLGCHQVMRPVSHTARWKDDVHGKFAALDRTSCATCHTADTCIRCHNQTPRSHVPLALFKNGGHATLALVNERSCLTCHTFENTCASCHKRTLR
ncbi:MAG: cytochrome c3 family protein [Acidobacteriota bacterium]|nr:cytochrome c3 family protein [Acidobacteriota bacterium]